VRTLPKIVNAWRSPSRVRRPIAVACIVLLAWLYLSVGHAPAHLDTARDLLIARDCVERGECLRQGAFSSFGGLEQGAAWVHVLEMSMRAHVRVRNVEHLVWLLAALAVGVAATSTLARASPSRMGIAAAAALLFIAKTTGWPTLWNPSLLPLPTAAFFAFLDRDDESRAPHLIALASLAWGVAVDAHIVAVLLLPGLLAAAMPARSDRLGHALLRAGGVLAGPLFVAISSWGSVVANARQVAENRLVTGGAFAVLLVATAVLCIPQSPRKRVRNTSFVYVMLLTLGSPLLVGHGIRAWYLGSLAYPVAGGVVAIFAHRVGRWLAIPAVGVAYVVMGAREVLAPRRSESVWTLAETERVAEALSSQGWTLADVLSGLDAQDGAIFVSTLSAFMPTGKRDPRHRALVVHRITDGGIPLGDGVMAALLPYAVPDLGRVERCVDIECAPLVPRDFVGRPFADLAYPERFAREPMLPSNRVSALRYRIPTPAGTTLTLERDPLLFWTMQPTDDGIEVLAIVRAGETYRDLGWLPPLRRMKMP
jgi:hypothetical protein